MAVSMRVEGPVVKATVDGPLMTIELNRPRVINSLNSEMIGLIRGFLEKAHSKTDCKCVLLCGAGDRGFCAGGDIKALGRWAMDGDFASAERFFEKEYALDLYIHEFAKPLLVLADGITMGGGLGLAAGASWVIATERTRMAMPETGIGFFPDVGATRWLLDKCPEGYPEFLGLSGYEMRGADAVCAGLATHLIPSEVSEDIAEELKRLPNRVFEKEDKGLSAIRSLLDPYGMPSVDCFAERDVWIKKHFSDQASLRQVFDSLRASALEDRFAQEILEILMNRSPTALALTFKLLRDNATRPLKEVFQVEHKAAAFMIRHPDYREGIRAQILEKDHRPRWNPKTMEQVGDFIGPFTRDPTPL
jgi:enoyl-CoA hydratase